MLVDELIEDETTAEIGANEEPLRGLRVGEGAGLEVIEEERLLGLLLDGVCAVTRPAPVARMSPGKIRKLTISLPLEGEEGSRCEDSGMDK